MSEFFSGLVERVKSDPIEILYSVIIFVGSSVCVLLIIRIALMVRRWYLHSLLRRQSPDFKTEVKYIRENRKPINRVQRFFLGQTGEILGFETIVILVIASCFVILEVWLIGKLDFESNIVIWGSRISSLCSMFYSIVMFFVGLYDFAKYGRFIPFLVNLMLIVVSAIGIYYSFFA